MSERLLGFNGERQIPGTDTYRLGNGYRTYSPQLQLFISPDSASPFGAGGINWYAYCAGDPVNQADPTGHFNWQSWLSIGMGVAGLSLTMITAGISIAAAGGVVASLTSASALSLVVNATSIISDVTGIACGGTQDKDNCASSILGWVSLGSGAAGLISGLSFAGTALSRTADALSMNSMPFLTSLRRMNGGIGLPLSGEFRNARFLGANRLNRGIAWNMRFEDDVSLGRRLTIVMSGEWRDGVLHAVNDTMVNGHWISHDYNVSALRDSVLAAGEDFSVYRLAIFDSAINQRSAGRSFAGVFRSRLRNQRPVVGFQGLPVSEGPVADALGRTYSLLHELESRGFGQLWGPDSAQCFLNGLSQRYGHYEGAITFSANTVVYPASARDYQNVLNWQ